MKKHHQTTQRKRIRSFTQELHRAFADWVDQLPFMKSVIRKEPKRKDQGQKSADQASASHPTGGTLTGHSVDNQL
jgi:hypothetical protein